MSGGFVGGRGSFCRAALETETIKRRRRSEKNGLFLDKLL
jgi:hypothetical protein